MRWHITLSRWFKDYIYIPLVVIEESSASYIQHGIVFIVSGLWYGANWTFICGGLGTFWLSNRDCVKGKFAAKWYGYVITQSFVLIAWLFFRSDNISAFFVYLKVYLLSLHLGIYREVLFIYTVCLVNLFDCI